MSQGPPQTVVYADDLALLAYQSRDLNVKALACNMLRESAHNSDPILRREDVIRVIREAKGSSFSPFVIADDFIEIAADLVQIAISRTGGVSRMRIVSEDTIGTAGGLMLLQSGASRLTPPSRMARGSSSRSCYVAPREAASAYTQAEFDSPVMATMSWDGSGYEITVSSEVVQRYLSQGQSTQGLPRWDRITATFQKHSRIVSPERTFSDIGLRVEFLDDGGIRIQTGSPESLMQFTSICAVPTTLVICRSASLKSRTSSVVFEIPSLKEMPLQLPLWRTRWPLPWASVPVSIPVDPDSPLAVAASCRFGDPVYNPKERA